MNGTQAQFRNSGESATAHRDRLRSFDVYTRLPNEIIEFSPSGERHVRFVAVSAKKTPAAVEELCLAYRAAAAHDQLPVLLRIATFVFDLLCIHPFRDGNGRVSRLVTSLLLRENGFQVARFISLERLIEETKEEYYGVLKLCSQGAHQGKNAIVPWWNYFLGRLRNAYQELERQVESVGGSPGKERTRASDGSCANGAVHAGGFSGAFAGG